MGNNVKDKSVDLVTNSIDIVVQKLLESGIFSGIPIFGWLASSIKFGLSLRDRFFISKIQRMINELGVSGMDQLKEFAESINDKYPDERIGIALFTLIDTSEDYEKSVIAGKILKYSLVNNLPKSDLLRLLSIVNRAYSPYLEFLRRVPILKSIVASHLTKSEIWEHFFSIGIFSDAGFDGGTFQNEGGTVYRLNKYGISLKNILFPYSEIINEEKD